MNKPSISRDVHFHDSVYGGPLAAKITTVHADGTVDLIVFPPVEVAKVAGVVFHIANVHASSGAAEAPETGCWNWPPRV
jgi:hypothetical protein